MILAIINNKGGTGKTTTCVSVAAALASNGYKVLVADLDAQASASLSMGIEFNKLSPSAADVLFDRLPIESAIREAVEPNVDLLTGHLDLANSDLVLSDVNGRENRLFESMAPVRDRYDFIICDCPPSLSTISVNALVAADYFIIPMTTEYLALEGLISMMDAIKKIQHGMNAQPQLLGIVFTMVTNQFSFKRKLPTVIMKLVRGKYGKMVFKTEIKRNDKLSEAPSRGKSIVVYANKSSGARDYRALADEIIQRLGGIRNG
jgi:chromosome partitioning protein